MAASSVKLPPGFVLEEPNLPKDFELEVVDIPLDAERMLKASMPSIQEDPEQPTLPQGITPQGIQSYPVREPSQWQPPYPVLFKNAPKPLPMTSAMLSPDTLGGRLAMKAPQIMGGTIGGMAGAATPWLGDELGMSLGGMKAGQWLWAPGMAAVGGGMGAGMMTPPGDPNRNSKIAFGMLEEGLGEYGGRLAAGFLGRMFLRPFRGSVVPEAEIADRLLRQAGTRTSKTPKTWLGKGLRGAERFIWRIGQRMSGEPGAAARFGERYGAHLLPGQSTESFMDTFQAVGEGSFFGGGAMRRFRTQTQKAALRRIQHRFKNEVVDNLIDSVGRQRAMDLLGDLSNADSVALKTIDDAMYRAIDDLSEQSIDISSLKELAEQFRGQGLKPGARERMLRQVAKKPQMQTFSELKNIRSDAWQEYKIFMKGIPPQTENARVAKLIANKTDDLMEQAARQGGEGLEAAWRTADKFHRGRLRAEWLTDTLAKYGKGEDVAMSKGFIDYLSKMSQEIGGRPSELSRMGFSESEIKGIKDVALATLYTTEKAQGGGRMLVQIAQGGAIIGLATGAATNQPLLEGSSATIIIGPTLMAYLMLSPTGSKLLSTGLRMPAGSRAAGTLTTRILREAALLEYERRHDGESPQLWFRYMSPNKKDKKPFITPGQLRRMGP